jgi:hypothetical protein
VNVRRWSTGTLRRWAYRLDALPDWAFLLPRMRQLRLDVGAELLARDCAALAVETGGHVCAPPGGWQ